MEDNNREYTNGEITVYWQPSKCIHSTICYTRLRSVFDPVKRPWVNMDGASTDRIIEIVDQCPTDALTYSRNAEGKTKEKPKEETQKPVKEEQKPVEIQEPSTRVQIMQNGPALITGDFVIKDINGNKLPKANTIAICRCGHSNNMPFCDGSHNRSGFKEKR